MVVEEEKAEDPLGFRGPPLSIYRCMLQLGICQQSLSFSSSIPFILFYTLIPARWCQEQQAGLHMMGISFDERKNKIGEEVILQTSRTLAGAARWPLVPRFWCLVVLSTCD